MPTEELSTISACIPSISFSPSLVPRTLQSPPVPIGSFGTPPAGFEDFAEISLSTDCLLGTMRLDWFTPDGLPDWGDGRLFLVGTEGTLELRKNLDMEGRPGGDHMFVSNKTRTSTRIAVGCR